MNLTWRNFGDYVKKEFTAQITSPTKGDKEPRYTFLEKNKKTYKLDNYSELEAVLGRFFASVNDTYVNNYDYYHALPDFLCNREGGDTCLRNWDEMFPNRSQVRFGKKDDNTEISEKVWDILKRIHDDWRTNMTRAKSLTAQANEIIQFFKNAELELKLEQIKTKHPEITNKLSQWISEYDKLDPNEQQEETINKFNSKLRYYNQLFNNSPSSKTYWQKVKDYRNWPWGTIAVSAGVGIVLFIIYLIVRKIFNFTG